MKKTLMAALLIAVNIGLTNAQTIHKQVVEGGGTGPYKAEVVEDATCPAFTMYRPQNLKEVVTKVGKLPVIVYANGGCQNNNVEMRYLLSEIASYGYVVGAIGPYDEEDIDAKWKSILESSYPEGKEDVILANGEKIIQKSPEELKKIREEQQKQIQAMLKAQAEARKKAGNNQQATPVQETYPRMLLEVLDWLTDQNATLNSEYYHCLDLTQVAAMGQSCGGAQVLGVAHDPRITTCVMLNTGIGDMEMQGTTKDNLNSLHQPMLYLIGGPADVAFPNANKDYERIADNIPLVLINTKDGHSGTYYEKSGGPYAVVVHKWLDWQLKGKVGQSALFLDDEYFQKFHPDWTVSRKNW